MNIRDRREVTLSIIIINILAWVINIIAGGGCFLGMGTIVVHLLGFGVGILFGYLCMETKRKMR